MKELILNVEGMHCEGCENRIKNAVQQIAGVESVTANHGEGYVKVILNNEVDEKIIVDAIEDIGFEVKED